MSTLAKILIPLGLVLPLGAFVAGAVAVSGADDPAPRETIVIRDAPTRSNSPHEDRSPSAHPSDDPTTAATHDAGRPRRDRRHHPSPDDLDDHGDDSGRDGSGDDSHGSGDSGSGPGRDDAGTDDGGHGGGHG